MAYPALFTKNCGNHPHGQLPHVFTTFKLITTCLADILADLMRGHKN